MLYGSILRTSNRNSLCPDRSSLAICRANIPYVPHHSKRKRKNRESARTAPQINPLPMQLMFRLNHTWRFFATSYRNICQMFTIRTTIDGSFYGYCLSQHSNTSIWVGGIPTKGIANRNITRKWVKILPRWVLAGCC